MKTVQIHGTIVDAWFDHPFFAADIEAGVITPVSRFRAALADALAADGEPVEIEINSPGGDVFAGSEMIAAIQDAGERIERVVVGGLAASMAANIAIMAGRPIAVHTNSLLFFHSATSEIWGGPGAHADEAALLDTVNAPMVVRLIEAGVDEARVREGFADGRNLVLGAEEAQRYLGAEIIGAEAAAPAPADDAAVERLQHPAAELSRLADYTATLAHVAKLAAWAPRGGVDDPATDSSQQPAASSQPAEGEAEAEAGADPAPAPAESADPAADAADGKTSEPAADAAAAPVSPAAASPAHAGDAAPSSDPAPATAPAPAEQAGAPERLAELEKQVRAVQSASGKKIHELTASLEAARAETADALAQRDGAIRERDAAQARLAELDKRVAQLTSALDKERTARADLVGGVLAPESDQEAPAGASSHVDAYNALKTDAEKRAYFRANFAAIQAEIRAARRH